jgi:N-acetylglutamate synthase-like GNAT family acetyltransferase
MELSIRTALISDSPAIAELSTQLGYETDSTAIGRRLQALQGKTDNCVFVAVDENNIVGWVHGFIALRVESDSFVEVAGLVVDTNCRGKGVGKQLVDEVASWAISHNCYNLRVRCNTKRTASHTFYKRIGFTLTKEQKIFSKELHV